MNNFVVVDAPTERAVFQQDAKQKSDIKVSGRCGGEATHVKIVASINGKLQNSFTVDLSEDQSFLTIIELGAGGWYHYSFMLFAVKKSWRQPMLKKLELVKS